MSTTLDPHHPSRPRVEVTLGSHVGPVGLTVAVVVRARPGGARPGAPTL